jgi:hypothetical protein
MEIKLSLTFACCCCGLSITVTLKCKGVGTSNPTEGTPAAVNVPCPDCGQMNHLLFDTRGKVRRVRPASLEQPAPEPSVN